MFEICHLWRSRLSRPIKCERLNWGFCQRSWGSVWLVDRQSGQEKGSDIESATLHLQRSRLLRSSIDEIIRQLRVGESSKRAENKRREKVSLTRKILHRFLGLISIHRGNESEKCFLSSVSYAISGCGFIRYCAIAARLGQKLSQRRSILPYKFQLTNSIDQLVNTRKTHMKWRTHRQNLFLFTSLSSYHLLWTSISRAKLEDPNHFGILSV